MTLSPIIDSFQPPAWLVPKTSAARHSGAVELVHAMISFWALVVFHVQNISLSLGLWYGVFKGLLGFIVDCRVYKGSLGFIRAHRVYSGSLWGFTLVYTGSLVLSRFRRVTKL